MADINEQTRLQRRNKKVRRRRRIIKIFGLLGILGVLAVAVAAGYFLIQLSSVTADTQEELERGEKSDLRTEAVDLQEDNFSVLIMGVDDRDGSNLEGRTDAMVLATFNKDEKTVKTTSIPRDSLVNIPGRGEDKITHAHAYGGTDLAIESVENLFNIPVDYYIKLDFIAFVEIVDALGGIEVDSPLAFTEQDSESNPNAIQIEEGEQTLNGEEALAFVRMRKQDPRGDLGRGERQQIVIESLINKSASFSSINKFDDVFDSVRSNMRMNFTFGNLVSLQGYSRSLDDVESLQLGGTDATINGIYYYQLDQGSREEISETLTDHLEIEGTNAYMPEQPTSGSPSAGEAPVEEQPAETQAPVEQEEQPAEQESQPQSESSGEQTPYFSTVE
ncbi:LytR family transcriptional attenuator [Sinobaca qinghaiensis]|uniref:LytR family transcriptional attenuator n=1 Tax=Sinobaca qinghaiensis TaxID=342944 RepID=A0A419V8T3_9BACL|nr:LCP family protein [Sinobaca qinghaiensis]RKD76505.1 LytR family transcriptional attenuator [Sinobaca qinghaiensis]